MWLAHGISSGASHGKNTRFCCYWFQTKLRNHKGESMGWVEKNKYVGDQLPAWGKSTNTNCSLSLQEMRSEGCGTWWPCFPCGDSHENPESTQRMAFDFLLEFELAREEGWVGSELLDPLHLSFNLSPVAYYFYNLDRFHHLHVHKFPRV